MSRIKIFRRFLDRRRKRMTNGSKTFPIDVIASLDELGKVLE